VFFEVCSCLCEKFWVFDGADDELLVFNAIDTCDQPVMVNWIDVINNGKFIAIGSFIESEKEN